MNPTRNAITVNIDRKRPKDRWTSNKSGSEAEVFTRDFYTTSAGMKIEIGRKIVSFGLKCLPTIIKNSQPIQPIFADSNVPIFRYYLFNGSRQIHRTPQARRDSAIYLHRTAKATEVAYLEQVDHRPIFPNSRNVVEYSGQRAQGGLEKGGKLSNVSKFGRLRLIQLKL